MTRATMVVGATGRIGAATLDALVEAGEEPTALVRAPARAAALEHQVDVRVGDLADASSLDEAFASIDALLLCSSHEPNMLQLQLNAIDAARRSGVRRVVKISASPASIFPGTPSVAAAQHLELEGALSATGMEWTAIRPNAFIQLLATFKSEIAEGRLPLTLGDAAVSWVDTRDVGAVAARALAADGPLPPIVEVTGPAAVTGEELAGIVSESLGRAVEYQPLSDPEQRAALTERGAPPWLIEHVITIFGLLRDRDGDRVTRNVEHWTGRAATGAAQVLARDAHKLGLADAVLDKPGGDPR